MTRDVSHFSGEILDRHRIMDKATLNSTIEYFRQFIIGCSFTRRRIACRYSCCIRRESTIP